MRIIVLFLAIIVCSTCFSFDGMEKGSLNLATLNLPRDVFVTGYELEDIVTSSGVDFSLDYYFKSGDIGYLYGSNELAIVDISNSSVNRRVDLVRWSIEQDTDDIDSIYHLGGDWVDQDSLNRNINVEYSQYLSVEDPSVGCLSSYPLRYGDVSDDGDDELLLLLSAFGNKSDLVIFSPRYERIVFSIRYALQDYILVDFSNYQYVMGYRQQQGTAGVRIYGKFYQGDFDEDGNTDFLVWRKRFDSLSKTDSLDGFSLSMQALTHYERDLEAQENSESGITGEYLPQSTDET